MTCVMWNLVLVCSKTVLVSVQDRRTVCAKCTIGLEIILDTPDGTPTCCGSSGSLFRSIWRLLVSVQDRCTVGANRTIGSEILLDEPDGSPR